MGIFPTKIRITSRPQGEPPEWVRDAWIGCELDCAPRTCGHVPEYCAGVVTGRLSKIDGYDVCQVHAFMVLNEKSPEAARWWAESGYPYVGLMFRFKSACAQVLETTDGEGPITVFDDIETGSMRPMPLDD
jgi:hypothetical protein